MSDSLLSPVRFIRLHFLHFLQWNPNFISEVVITPRKSVKSKLFFMTTMILIYIPWSLPLPEFAYWRSFLDLFHWPMDNWNSKLYLNFLHFYSHNLPKYELSDGDYETSNWSLFLICVFYVQKYLLILKVFSYSITLIGFIPSTNYFIFHKGSTTLTLEPSFLAMIENHREKNYSWFHLYYVNYKPWTRTSDTLIRFFFHLGSLILDKLCLLQRHAHPGPIQSIPSLVSSLLWCATMTSHICYI